MSNIPKRISARSFKGSCVPVGSEIGRILLRNTDSEKIVSAIRATAKDKPQTVKLSKDTMTSLRKYTE